MKTFLQIINELGAEDRRTLIDQAREFLDKRGEFDTCLFCWQNLTNLVCDCPVGYEWTGATWRDGKRQATLTNSERFTCDLPVCEACRTLGSPIFFHQTDPSFICSGGDVHIEGGSEIFVPDLCPLHRTQTSIPVLSRLMHPYTMIISSEEVGAWRVKTRMMLESGCAADKVPAYPQVLDGPPGERGPQNT